MSLPIRIVITGGPCAGKSSALSAVREEFGRSFSYIPETPTLLLEGGFYKLDEVDPQHRDAWFWAFQDAIYHTQSSLERAAYKLARLHDQPIILCDRGLADGIAYHPEGAEGWFGQFCITERLVYKRYDYVLFLESLAVSRPELFGRTGNEHRYESLDEAIETNERTKLAWQRHTNFVQVPQSDTLEQKIEFVRAFLTQILEENT